MLTWPESIRSALSAVEAAGCPARLLDDALAAREVGLALSRLTAVAETVVGCLVGPGDESV
jgi:hypothetical protein